MSDSLHFLGIGGIGMSALARIALARGMQVSGSNDTESDTTRALRNEGATVFIGHQAAHLVGTPRVIVTSAVRSDNPELLAAQALGLEILSRGALLAEFFNAKRGIAIAGTHGKTTVTGMTASILEEAGLDPTVAVGGLRRESGTNFRCGAGAWFVSESDESDGSFLALRPEIAVVLNLENDHVANDEEMENLRRQFVTFLEQIPDLGLAIIGIDDPDSAALVNLERQAETWTFGFSKKAWMRAETPRYDGLGSRFHVYEDHELLGEVTLMVPGRLNAINALAATTVARALDIPFATIAAALAKFGGVRRRFDIVARTPRMIVVDDYAHHPTAVEATIAAARNAHSGPIIVAFQPHRYTRTAYLATDFAHALEGADAVYLTEIYAASESPIEGITERSIGEPLAEHHTAVYYTPRSELVETLLERVPEHALVLMLGAGDITHAARELAQRVINARDLAQRESLPV